MYAHIDGAEGVGLRVQLAHECLEQLVHAGRVHDHYGALAHPRPHRPAMPPSVSPCHYFALRPVVLLLKSADERGRVAHSHRSVRLVIMGWK